jgi:hypothetical protein
MKTTKRTKPTRHESTATSKTPKPPPTEEEIRQRAHQIFLSRGGIPGRELEDWLLAEKQIFCERIEEFERQNQ